jgi:hypothetical protein
MVMYKDGTDRLRFDISAEEDGETTSIILINTPDLNAFCMEGAGEFAELLGAEATGEGICLDSDPTGGSGAGDFVDIVDEIENGEWELISQSEREIAGQDATCYETRDAEGEVSTACFSDDGHLLAALQPDGSGIEATSVSDDVGDGDFELPYEVVELPDFGAPTE